MKRLALMCLGLLLMSSGIGCCLFPHCGMMGGGYGAPMYNPACPTGNCGVGYYGPSAAAYSTYDSVQVNYPAVAPAPVAIAPSPVYYGPYPTTAMNYLPTY